MRFSKLRRFAILAMLSLFLAILYVPLVIANAVYTVSFPGIPLSGTITTDGNTGALSSADILSWNLSTPPNVHFLTQLVPGDSAVSVTGAVLIASPSRLTFDFSSNSPGELAFETPNTGSNDVMDVLFCDGTTCADQNGGNFSSTVRVTLVAPGCCAGGAGQNESGVQVIAVNDSIPEPALLPIVLTGLGVIGLLHRWKRSNTALGRTVFYQNSN
jgi:hypothetical protein